MWQFYEDGINRDFAGLKHDTYAMARKPLTAGPRNARSTRLKSPACIPNAEKWRDLRTLVVTTSCVTVDGNETCESRMYLSDLGPHAKSLSTAIRKHWGIENGQHWVLDVMFGEDSARQQDRHGAANLAAVRRLAVSLLRQEKTLKRGAKCKRMALPPSTRPIFYEFFPLQNRCVSPCPGPEAHRLAVVPESEEQPPVEVLPAGGQPRRIPVPRR